MSSPKANAPSQRRTRVPRQQRRRQLIDIAERITLEEGVPALTMERLAEEAGVAKTVVYSHFANSTEAVLEVLDLHWRRMDERLRTIERLEELSVEHFLRDHAVLYLGEMAKPRLRLRRLLQAARLNDEAAAAIRERQANRRRALARRIQRDYGLDGDSAVTLATFLLGALGALGARAYPKAAERRRVVAGFLSAAEGAIQALLASSPSE